MEIPAILRVIAKEDLFIPTVGPVKAGELATIAFAKRRGPGARKLVKLIDRMVELKKVERTEKVALPQCDADSDDSAPESNGSESGEVAPVQEESAPEAPVVEEPAPEAPVVEEPAPEAPVEKDDLRQLPDVGAKTEEQLNELGLYTYAQVAEADVKLIASVRGVSKDGAKAIKETAAEFAAIEGDDDGESAPEPALF